MQVGGRLRRKAGLSKTSRTGKFKTADKVLGQQEEYKGASFSTKASSRTNGASLA